MNVERVLGSSLVILMGVREVLRLFLDVFNEKSRGAEIASECVP